MSPESEVGNLDKYVEKKIIHEGYTQKDLAWTKFNTCWVVIDLGQDQGHFEDIFPYSYTKSRNQRTV